MRGPTVSFTSDNGLTIFVNELSQVGAEEPIAETFELRWDKCGTPHDLAVQLRAAAAFVDAHSGLDLEVEVD